MSESIPLNGLLEKKKKKNKQKKKKKKNTSATKLKKGKNIYFLGSGEEPGEAALMRSGD